jgi:hypothetical protein
LSVLDDDQTYGPDEYAYYSYGDDAPADTFREATYHGDVDVSSVGLPCDLPDRTVLMYDS